MPRDPRSPTHQRNTAAQAALALRKAAAEAAGRYEMCPCCGAMLAGLFPGSPHRCKNEREPSGGER
jgi:hypothetical protein